MLIRNTKQSHPLHWNSFLFAQPFWVLLQPDSDFVTRSFSTLLFLIAISISDIKLLDGNRPLQYFSLSLHRTISSRYWSTLPTESIECIYNSHSRKKPKPKTLFDLLVEVSFPLIIYLASSFFSAWKWPAPAQKFRWSSTLEIFSEHWTKITKYNCGRCFSNLSVIRPSLVVVWTVKESKQHSVRFH